MSPTTRTIVTWAPRLVGIATVLFLSLFALDSFNGRSFAQGLADFAVHLVPSVALAAVVLVAWRFPWVGAAVFGLLAAAYATNVTRHPDWVLLISGPLALTAVLYAASLLATRSELHSQHG